MSNLESCLIFEIFSNKYDGSLPKYFKIIELLFKIILTYLNAKNQELIYLLNYEFKFANANIAFLKSSILIWAHPFVNQTSGYNLLISND